MIDITEWDKRNIWVDHAGEMVVRPGMQRSTGAWALDMAEFFGGFSTENPRTGEPVHYVLAADSNEDTYILMLDQEFIPRAKVHVGARLRPDGPFQGGVLSNGQLLMGAPGMPMYWGYVGNGFKVAKRTISALDVDFTTQTINDGLVASWQNRIVLGVRDALYFSDIGSPRAFLAGNTTPAPGFIYFLAVSQSGMLFMGTTNGMYQIAADSAYAGEIVNPVFQKINEFPITSFFQACTTDKGPVALSKSGLVSAAAYGGDELMLGDQRITRTLNDPIHFEDYKVGKVFSTREGPMVSMASEQDQDSATYMLLRVYERKMIFSWFESARQDGFKESVEVRGVLQDEDGTEFILTDKSIFLFYGNSDSVPDDPIGRFVIGSMAGKVPIDPQANPVVRSITTASDNVGTLQYASIQGVQKSATPHRDSDHIPMCDVTVWNDTTPNLDAQSYYTRRLHSIRHLFSLRTSDLAIEIGVEGSGFRMGLISYVSKGPGQFRPAEGEALVPATLTVVP